MHIDDHMNGLIQELLNGEVDETYWKRGNNEINILNLGNIICKNTKKSSIQIEK